MLLIKLCLEKAEDGGTTRLQYKFRVVAFLACRHVPAFSWNGLVARSKPSERFEHGIAECGACGEVAKQGLRKE